MINDFCRAIAHFFLKQKKLILFFYKTLVVFGVLTVLLSWVVTSLHPLWREVGKFSGTASVILLFLSLLPGMMKRFGVRGCLQSAQMVLMSYRRYTGIAMYLTAVTHYLWIKFFPAMTWGRSPLAANTFEFMGTIALMMAFPLFLTSNDQSMKWLKKNWQLLHKLTYLVLAFIVLHLWLMGRVDSKFLLAAITLFLEIFSYAVAGVRKKLLA